MLINCCQLLFHVFVIVFVKLLHISNKNTIFASSKLSLTMNTITINVNHIKISVSVYLFKEGDTYIAYCPSLDLSGYDTTEETAKKDFEYILKDWLKTQAENNTLKKDLELHGWRMGNNTANEPGIIDLLGETTTSKLLSLPDYRKTNVNAEILC